MLQIDESQVQVYQCFFKLTLVSARVPLKLTGSYFVDWKIKNSKSGIKTKEVEAQPNTPVTFNQTITLKTQMLLHTQDQLYLHKDSIVTLYLISSKRPDQQKIVGNLILPLQDVLNTQQYSQEIAHKLSYCSMDAQLIFSCNCSNKNMSNILAINLDLALFSQQYVWTKRDMKQKNKLKINGIPVQEASFQKKKNVYIANQENNQKTSQKPPQNFEEDEYETPETKNILCRTFSLQNSQNLLINKASFYSEPHLKKITEEDEQIIKRLKNLESRDLQMLVRENGHLKKLLFHSRSQRKLQRNRFQQELKELARDLSLKEVELVTFKQQHESILFKMGELMDEREGWQREKQSILQKLKMEQTVNLQFQDNYNCLEKRVNAFGGWEGQKTELKKQIQELKIGNAQLLGQIQKIELGKSYQISKLMAQLSTKFEQSSLKESQLKSNIDELTTEVTRKQKIINLYQQKFSKLQDQINTIQDVQYVHRSEYYNLSETRELHEDQKPMTQYKPKKHYRQQKIHIQDSDDVCSSLKQINQQQNEDSLMSIDDKYKNQAEINTSTTLFDRQNQINQIDKFQGAAPINHDISQLELLKLLTQNLQKQYNHLKKMYQKQEENLYFQINNRKCIGNDFEQLKYQFICQLSRVTAQVNKKILQNKELREQNVDLQTKLQKILDKEWSCVSCGSHDIHQIQQIQSYSVQTHRYEIRSERISADRFQTLNRYYSGIETQSQIKGLSNKIQQFEDQLQKIELQKLQYFDRCHRLEQQNALLIKINREKEQLYDHMGSRIYDLNDSRLFVEKFQSSLHLILENSDKYQEIIGKYGLSKNNQEQINALKQEMSLKDKKIEEVSHKLEEAYQLINNGKQTKLISFKKQVKEEKVQTYNLSDIIKNFSATDPHENSEGGQSNESKRMEGDLLIESTARVNHIHWDEQSQLDQNGDASNPFELKRLIGQISHLVEQRQRNISLLQNFSSCKQRYPQQSGKERKLQMKNKLQMLKNIILQRVIGDIRITLLTAVRDLEQSLTQSFIYC